ncbi:MAG: bifunctional riboflavin kinase/FAD synthetase [Acidobacteria bacterium]|nr:bifunctional riboflavin kinase/FAD synthetase [Acidobacteriota bacterium]
MIVVRGLEHLPPSWLRPVVTIGNFDGVHIGHQSVLRTLVARSERIGGIPVVLTFDPHPLQVLAPDNAPRQIQTLRQKLAALAELGAGGVVVLPFTRDLAHMSARDFVTGVLRDRLHVREVHVGASFAFGYRREGSFNLLKEMGDVMGFHVEKVHQVQFRGNRVSSTMVRQALITGQVSLARRLLGRPFSLEGEVVHGMGIGAGIRVPTANLSASNELRPRHGVYVTVFRVNGKSYESVTNIGTRPTVTRQMTGPVTIESHILDFDGDLYGVAAELDFLLRVREERRFASPDALASRIQRDITVARRYFGWVRRMKPGMLREGVGIAPA